MQAISLNRITQGLHGASKAVDYAALPDPIIYAPEDMTFVSYGQQGAVGTEDDAGLALRMRGASGLHQFAHTSKSLVSGSVKRGQQIAVMGHTGYTIPQGVLGAHCHWWIQTANGYAYPPSLINEAFVQAGQGTEEMIIQNSPNWFARCNKTMRQVRNRDLGKVEFEKFAVGSDWYDWSISVSDNPEADKAYYQQTAGTLLGKMIPLAEGVVVFKAKLATVNVYDLTLGVSTGDFKPVAQYKKGDIFEAVSFIDGINSTRYYVRPSDALSGKAYGFNTYDVEIVDQYKPGKPGTSTATPLAKGIYEVK